MVDGLDGHREWTLTTSVGCGLVSTLTLSIKRLKTQNNLDQKHEN